MQVEKELKFRLSPRAAGRVWNLLPRAGAPRARRVESVYYDTPLMELRAARAALRLRRDGRRWLQTFKLAPRVGGALAERFEWEIGARDGVLDVNAFPLRQIEAAAQADLRATLLRARPLFSTTFERRAARFSLPDGTRIEAAVDRGWIAAGRRRQPLHELELELLEGDASSMMKFAEELVAPLGLFVEQASKAERGYGLAAGEAPAPVKARRPHLDCDGDAAAAMLAASIAALSQVGANAGGVAAGHDPEYLHQLRVGLRRLRAALRAWRRAAGTEPARSLERALRGFSSALGPARDWDVFLGELEVDAAPVLRNRARRRRALAAAAAAQAVCSAPCQRFLVHAAGILQAPPPLPAGQSARAFARLRLGRAQRKALAQGARPDWNDAVARHALRIRLKRLRYIAEFFASCFPVAPAERYIDRLRELQDILGELNDVAVGLRLLDEIAVGAAARPAAAVRRRFVRRERRLLRALDPAWRRFRLTRRLW